jgi:hypothetical protein
VVRKYLQTRYALAPSIIAAGQLVQERAFPPVARCDLLWPAHPEARSNHQYIHLGAANVFLRHFYTKTRTVAKTGSGQTQEKLRKKRDFPAGDTLVAPLDEQEMNRSVWIPPGDWQDAWDGSIVTGPRTINVTKPFSQIPMWHRRGGILITTHSANKQKAAQRIAEQDWSELTLHAFPSESSSVSSRRLVAGAQNTIVQLATDGAGAVSVHITPPPPVEVAARATAAAVSRAWCLRVHLAPTQRVTTASLDGGAEILVDAADAADATTRAKSISGTSTAPLLLLLQHIEPSSDCGATFPFEGLGVSPACKAGPVAELCIPASAAPRRIELRLTRSLHEKAPES